MRKSRLALILSSFLFVISLNAQLQIEFKLGLDNTTAIVNGISENISPTTRAVTNPSIAIATSYKLDKYFSIGTGASYQRKGFDLKEGTAFNISDIDIPLGVEFRYRETSLNIPMYLQFSYPVDRLELFVKTGASANLGLGGNYKTIATSLINFTLSDTEIAYGNRISKTVYNGELAVGMAFAYNNGKILTELGYSKALSNKIEDTSFDLNVKQRTISINIGYALMF